MDPEALYRQLGQHIAQTPTDLGGPEDLSPESHRWLGRATALIGALSEIVGHNTVNGRRILMDQVSFNMASESLAGKYRHDPTHKIITILHRTLAVAEMLAPAAAQGAFIPVGAAFDAFQVIGKVLGSAKKDVLLVDAYMDEKVLTDFAPLASDRVSIRLLTDSHSTKPAALQPATTRWAQQYGDLRPIEARLTPPRQLHDRLIVIDVTQVWSLTQSLKDFANRSPASVLRVEGDLAKLKIEAYEGYWVEAQRLGG